MRQKHINKKRQNPYQDITSGFTSASTLYSSQKISKASTLSHIDIANPTSNIASSSQMSSKIQEKLNFYHQKAVVFNTEKLMRIWINQFEEFRKNHNYTTPLEEIIDTKLIEQQVCEYIAQMSKKKNAGEYKTKTIKQAIDAINRHLVKISPIRGINSHDKYEFPDLKVVLHDKMKDLQKKVLVKKKDQWH